MCGQGLLLDVLLLSFPYKSLFKERLARSEIHLLLTATVY